MKEVLEYLFEGHSLTQKEAQEVLTRIGQNYFSEIEISSFLTVYQMRRITPEEMAGFRNALLDLCLAVDLSDFETIDVCGTGGDGKNTFNISTISSFVLAGAGFRVVKHGNFGVSGPVGSSNLFEQAGYRFSNDSRKLRREVEEAGITFLHAPLFHPAMKYVAPVRKTLRTKTFFNMLGPMINPAFPRYQLIGVYSPAVQDLYGQVYREQGNRCLIVHSLDGYDEISLTGRVRLLSGGREEFLEPATLGFDPVAPEALAGGKTVAAAASVFMELLSNRATPAQKNVVLANAAAGIRCFRPETSWEACVAAARESLESGKALARFKHLIDMQ
ncbi:MAG TPA: anthranilate phosphoribosyltransferase [Prolixibacteraceae bacterium]|jgi:anthranilate phosphoribosyltransferase|nr:anthranilate phosphoribosyltransferase [Bacteroidales bacterium]HNQ36788.1 anthranilate phosphoribosyltransferase [Prolixibacteraceae bacterium]HOY50476.1 anthranilate phosphoribosyltransferase [Prolixibacteraceae bacterium]